MSTNGLDMLDSAIEKRRHSARSVPPPRHRPKQAPQTSTQPSQGTAPQPAATPAASAPQPAAGTAAEQAVELRRVTVYLEADAAEWLDAVLAAGKQMKPRVNSASAVIRLAIARLEEQLTPPEAALILQQRAADKGTQPGRKRV